MKNDTLSRRSFIGGAGLLAGALGAAGLIGAPHTPEAFAGETTTESASESDGSSWEAIAPVEAPSDWDYECDVLVVGAGGAGGAAAVQAAEDGARVIVLERANIWGGNAQFSMVWGLTPDIPAETVFAYEIAAPAITVSNNTALVKKLAEESADNLNWMIAHGEGYMDYRNDIPLVGYEPGMVFCPVPAGYEPPANPSIKDSVWYQWFPYNGRGFTNTMQRAAENLGVEVLYGLRAAALVTDSDRIVGVMAQREDGTAVYVKASATILATGGYTANFDMLKHYCSEEDYRGVSKYCGTPLALGDGIRMAQGAGAWITDMDFIAPWDGGTYDPKHMGASAFYCVANQMNRQSSLTVNKFGERFMNEGGNTTDAYVHQASLKNGQPESVVFTILDSTMISLDDIVDKFNPLECEIPVPWWDEQLEEQINDGIILKAESIEELAGLMEVDPAVLARTVERYNELCDKGSDEDFLKESQYLWPLREAPFYATKGVGGSLWCTYGGIRYDDSMRVMREDGTTIPGLYCAGETAALMACNNRVYPTGRIAGRTAVADL